MLDVKTHNFWTTKNGDTSAVIEFKMKSPQSFDILQLQENIRIGQRIERFRAEYLDGGEWKLLISGTTVGYKRILKFDPVTADRIRIIIESSRLNPTLAEVGLFREAK